MKKSFEQCCDEVAKKYPSNEFDHIIISIEESDKLISRFSEAAELYAAEVARETIELAREKELKDPKHIFASYTYTEQEILNKLKL